MSKALSRLMEGKKGVVFGITNSRSIGWNIASELLDAGAQLALSYQNESCKKRIIPLIENTEIDTIFECDVLDSEAIYKARNILKEKWSGIDFIVHSIAFSDKQELRGRFVDTSRSNFLNAMDISCYSFVKLVKEMLPILNKDSSIITLTYYGSEKVVPNYNVMGLCKAALESGVRYLANDLGPEGIRVNAISAGPIRTLASSGIDDFHYIMEWNAQNSPLRRNVTTKEVAQSALFLLSDMSSGVTGEILKVDAGYHSIGMKMANN